MPYKIEKIKLSETQDRRKKITESQRKEINELYGTGLYSLNNLAKKYDCSKKTILLIVNENSAANAKQYRKENWKQWQRKGEEHNKAIKNTRRYKQSLYLKGELKELEESKEN